MKSCAMTLICLVLLTACQPPYPPEFRGAAFNPICIIACDAKFTNSDADPGATVTSTNSNTQTGGTKSGGATVTGTVSP